MINSISVLFVTRSPEFAGQLIGRMRYRGHAVRPKQAGNERDLNRLLQSHRFDAIVLAETDIEITLDHINEALQRSGRSTPIVLLTDRDETTRLGDIENGAFAIVTLEQLDLAAIMTLRAVEFHTNARELNRVRMLLQEADRRYLLMLDTSRHPVACFRRGMTVYANDAWRECFEIDLTESLDRIALEDLVVPEQHDELERLLDLRQTDLENLEICEPLTLRTKRGRTFDADLILSTALISGDPSTVVHISRAEDGPMLEHQFEAQNQFPKPEHPEPEPGSPIAPDAPGAPPYQVDYQNQPPPGAQPGPMPGAPYAGASYPGAPHPGAPHPGAPHPGAPYPGAQQPGTQPAAAPPWPNAGQAPPQHPGAPGYPPGGYAQGGYPPPPGYAAGPPGTQPGAYPGSPAAWAAPGHPGGVEPIPDLAGGTAQPPWPGQAPGQQVPSGYPEAPPAVDPAWAGAGQGYPPGQQTVPGQPAPGPSWPGQNPGQGTPATPGHGQSPGYNQSPGYSQAPGYGQAPPGAGSAGADGSAPTYAGATPPGSGYFSPQPNQPPPASSQPPNGQATPGMSGFAPAETGSAGPRQGNPPPAHAAPERKPETLTLTPTGEVSGTVATAAPPVTAPTTTSASASASASVSAQATAVAADVDDDAMNLLDSSDWSSLPLASLQPLKRGRRLSPTKGEQAPPTPANAAPGALAQTEVRSQLRSQRRLLEAVQDRLTRSPSAETPFALMVFALDAPPPGLGAEIESLHAQIGQILEREFPKASCLALLEDGHYGVFLSEATRNDLEAQLNKMLEHAASHIIDLGTASISGVMSCGVVLLDESQSGPEDLLDKAQRALEDARKNGGHCHKFHKFPTRRDGNTESDLVWRARIEDAMQNDRLQLLYQPLVSLHGTDVPRYSVFARLRSADGEMFEPTEFLPAAERTGVAADLDQWIIQHTLVNLSKQLKRNPQTIFFLTLSQSSLSGEAVVGSIHRFLERYQVSPRNVVIEFKEATILTHLKSAVVNGRGLRAMGIDICVGDFGNGLDPFQILRHVDASYIKLDRAYVANLARDEASQTTIHQLTRTAHGGGRQVIVPFVEDASTLAVLFGVGVNLVQGFFVHPPGEQLDYNFGQGL